ncbi:7244_t:CDS:2 [Diversispora eburnea]|uniref:7244_t:CDS:1 n=1 Tax=Diversispora eburnea TaxID=1213867 RepID=A0A9N9D9L3_9GLOM|nr:7244_t:CDS:2 [Diversispora eburnea]
MTKQLVPKLSNFKYTRHTNQETTDIKEIINILRWMAPEKMLDPKNVRYNFKFLEFYFGNYCFKKIPYEDLDMNQIKNPVLKGGQEKITMQFTSQEIRTIQNKFFEIIIAALNPLGTLFMRESISIGTLATELPDSFQNFTLPTIVPLEEEGLPDGKKDPVQANLLFKEAADDGIAGAQLHYAFSLFNTSRVKFDRKVFVSYLTKAANGGNVAAQYNLDDMYFNGKILGIKDVELGTKYLKLAALNNDPRSVKILKENKIDFLI